MLSVNPLYLGSISMTTSRSGPRLTPEKKPNAHSIPKGQLQAVKSKRLANPCKPTSSALLLLTQSFGNVLRVVWRERQCQQRDQRPNHRQEHSLRQEEHLQLVD